MSSTWHKIACAIAPMLPAACADEGAFTATPTEDWATETAYEIGDHIQDDAFFGPHLDVRAATDGSRVYVLDLQASEVTIWTPDGALSRRMGRSGGGPGEFHGAGSLGLAESGFYVRDLRRITMFTPDGELIGTRPYPLDVSYRGFPAQIQDHFSDGSLVALPSPMVLDASFTSDPPENLPLLRVVAEGDASRTEELALLNFRNWQTSFEVEGSSRPIPLMQPWVTPDHFAADHLNGSVVIKRGSTTSPGLIGLVEISTAGDTLWTRRIQLPPIPLAEEQIDAEVEEWAAMIAQSMGDANASPMLKSSIRAAWSIPEYWPAVRQIRLMSNGEVWFGPLGLETPGLWYAVRKGANEGPIKRITVPESFQPLDATATHVWGVRRDELDVGYVTGLRLLPGQLQEPP